MVTGGRGFVTITRGGGSGATEGGVEVCGVEVSGGAVTVVVGVLGATVGPGAVTWPTI